MKCRKYYSVMRTSAVSLWHGVVTSFQLTNVYQANTFPRPPSFFWSFRSWGRGWRC